MIARFSLYVGTLAFMLGAYAWLLVGMDALVLIPPALLAVAGAVGVGLQKGPITP